MKTHLVPITFLSFGLGTSSQVSFFWTWLSSYSIALTQCLSLLASLTSFDSTIDSKDKCTGSGICICFLLLVSTPVLLSPIICFGGWFFCTCWLGVFEGVSGTCWLLPSSNSSSACCFSFWFSSSSFSLIISPSSYSSGFSCLFGDGIDSSIFTLIVFTTLPNLKL